MRKKIVWDKLKFQRTTPEGGQYFKGERGVYLLLFDPKDQVKNRIGKVILNREYLTGLFKSRLSSEEFLGDLRDKKKFLIFRQTGNGKLIIYSKDKKK